MLLFFVFVGEGGVGCVCGCGCVGVGVWGCVCVCVCVLQRPEDLNQPADTTSKTHTLCVCAVLYTHLTLPTNREV